jgi:hypothetical protein
MHAPLIKGGVLRFQDEIFVATFFREKFGKNSSAGKV